MIQIIEKIDGQVFQNTEYKYLSDPERELQLQKKKVMDWIADDDAGEVVASDDYQVLFCLSGKYHLYECHCCITEEYQEVLAQTYQVVQQKLDDLICERIRLENLLGELKVDKIKIDELYHTYCSSPSLVITSVFFDEMIHGTLLMSEFLSNKPSFGEDVSGRSGVSDPTGIVHTLYGYFSELLLTLESEYGNLLRTIETYNSLKKEIERFPVNDESYLPQLKDFKRTFREFF